MILVPAAWFKVPFEKSILKVVRPPTMTTRRVEMMVKVPLPRVLFEELMAPLTESDVEGLKRASGQLVPTTTTLRTHQFNYLVKRGSVSDRLFRLQDRESLSSSAQPKRGSGCARVRLAAASQRRGGLPQTMSMVCGNVSVKYSVPLSQSRPPQLQLVFGVLTMDRLGHITWPKDFDARSQAALRLQACALLRAMIADPLNPADATMAPALTAHPSSSVRAVPAPRQLVPLPPRA